MRAICPQRTSKRFLLVVALVSSLFCCVDSPTSADITTDIRNQVVVCLNNLGITTAARQAKALLDPSAIGLSAIKELKDPFNTDLTVAAGTVLRQASIINKILKPLTTSSCAKAFNSILSSQFFSMLPNGSLDCGTFDFGQVKLSKNGSQFTIYVTISGPGSTRAIVGVSNANPICDIYADRMQNNSSLPIAYIDLSAGGLSYIQARMGLGTAMLPQIRAKAYIPVGQQNLVITFGAFDPERLTIEAKVSLGFEGTVDDVLSGDIGIEGELSFEVDPAKAAPVMLAVASAMKSEAQRQGISVRPKMQPSSTGVPGGFEVRNLDKTALVFQAGVNKLKELADTNPECFGKASLGVEFSAEAGLGIWDTKMEAVSVGAGVSVSVPIAVAAQAGGRFVTDFFRQAVALAPTIHQLGSGQLGPSSPELQRVRAQLVDASRALARSIQKGLWSITRNIEAEFSFSIKAAGESNQASKSKTSDSSGGAQKKADTAMKVFEAKAVVPLGKGIDAALDGTRLTDLIRALADIGATGGPFIFNPTDIPLNFSAAAQALIDDTKIEIECSPIALTGVTIEAEIPAKPFFTAMATARDTVKLLLDAINAGISTKSLKPLRDRALWTLFSGSTQAFNQFRSSKFGISQGFGTNFDLGAEATSETGLGYAIYAEANPEIMFMFADPLGFDCPDVQGEAEIGLEVTYDQEGEVNLGEAAELTASGGVSVTSDVLYLNIKEHDGPLPAPPEVTVAGFRVTNFQGVQNSDGSFSGSGDLQLPVAGSVQATFAVDKNGHVTSGSWSGGITVVGRTFTIASGTLDDNGLHWNHSTTIGPVQNVSIAYNLKSNGAVSASGYVDYSVAGIQKRFVVKMDSSGVFTATYTGDVTLNGFKFSDTNLSLSSSGVSGSGQYTLPGVGAIRFTINIPVSGTITAFGSTTLSVGGFQVSNLTLNLGQSTISGSGTVTLPNGSNAAFTVTVNPNGTFSVTSNANLSIHGWNLTQTNLTLSNTGIGGSGKVTLPGGSEVTLNVNLTSTGQLTGSAGANITVNGWALAGTEFRVSNDTISGEGQFQVPNGPRLNFTASVKSNGTFTAEGTGNLTLCGFNLANSSYRINNDKIVGSGNISLPGGSQGSLGFEITKTGQISGSMSGALSIAGWQIGSASLTLSNTGLNGSGNVTLPGGNSYSFTLGLTPSGQFSGSVNTAVSVRGWSIGSANLTISNDTMTGSGMFTLPGGTSTSVGLTIKSDGYFKATGTGGVAIKGWNLVNAAFEITNDSATASGNIDLVGASAAFTFQIYKNGTFTGHSSASLSIPMPQGKSIQISSVSLDVQPDGTISGTGNVGLANRTISSASISITPGGKMFAKGDVSIGGASLSGTCTIGRNTFSISGSVSKSATVSVAGNSCTFSGVVELQASNFTGVKARASGTIAVSPLIGPNFSTTVGADVNLDTGEVEFEIPGPNPKFDFF
ncbi:MAG: hypothetical protein N3B12_00105 [Armatimonadetes bacterium]|nr:hypothetical protein [Armatimonadota bacterium]